MRQQDAIDALVGYIHIAERKAALMSEANARYGYIKDDMEKTGKWEEYQAIEAEEERILSTIGVGRFWGDFGIDETVEVIRQWAMPIILKLEENEK